MEPSEKDVKDLRSSFFKKCEDENILGNFHQNDIYRAENDDHWLKRFLMHHDNDQKEALNMMIETCEWRKKFGTNDITEENINVELLESGSVFSTGKDKDDKTLLIFKSKKHLKGTYSYDDLRRHLVYWMERLEREEKGEMISIFFDMYGAGYSNMDLDYTKYIISLFKNYYPYFLNYIIIFEMAWVLNAAFKVIKTWLPPKAIKKIKFVNKSNLKDLVKPEHALRSWGGLNDYVFVFKPEEKPEETVCQEECKKKVHFADRATAQDQATESRPIEPAGTLMSGTKLLVTPSDFLPFAYKGNDLMSSIILRNDDAQCLSYKIKTTSPKKFKVQPNVGVLLPEKSATITVVLLTGYELPGLNRDKFLIMSLPIESPDLPPESLVDLWKNAPEEKITSCKLRCCLSQPPKVDGSIKNGSAFGNQSSDDQRFSKVTSDMVKIQNSVSNLRDDVKIIRRQQWIIAAAILLLACVIVYISSNNGLAKSDQNCWVMNVTEE